MTKLSFIESEASRQLGRMPRQDLATLQRSLIKLCENHWADIRGPEPATGLVRALWAVTPHFADLLVDLYSVCDAGLSEATNRLPPAKVLAALVLAEIERGDAEGARLAHEAMMVFDSPHAREIYTHSVRSRLRGSRPEPGKWRKHVHHDPFYKAVGVISAETGRYDLSAVTVAIEFLSATQAAPATSEGNQSAAGILEFMRNTDLVFQGIEDGRINYTLRGAQKKPVSSKRLQEILEEIRGSP